MKPDEAGRQLASLSEDVKAAGEGVSLEPLLQAAQQVAQQLRLQASRSGHSIGIRVAQRGQGVRLTVTGRHAIRYRRIASQELSQLMPGAQAEIRAQITRRVR